MKLKNKILSAMMIVAASMSIVTISAFAASVTLTPSTTEVKAGGTITVDVTTVDNPGVCAIGFKVTGTNDTFTLDKFDDAALYENAILGNDLTKATYSISWWPDDMFESESTASGKVGTLTYTVKADVQPGTYPITISNDANTSMNMNGDVVDFGTATVNITVVADTPAKETTALYYEATAENVTTANKGVKFTVATSDPDATKTTSADVDVDFKDLTVEAGNVVVGLIINNIYTTAVDYVTVTTSLY